MALDRVEALAMKQSTRRLLAYGSNASLVSVLVLIFLVGIYLFADHKRIRIDMSESAENTLSVETLEKLQLLDLEGESISITAFSFQRGAEDSAFKDRAVRDLLREIGFQSGSMIGLLVAPLLMSRFGIAGPFYVFGAIGVAWAAVWNARATSYPRANERVGEEELKFIEDGGAIVDHLRSSSSESSSSSSGKEIDDEVVVVTEVEKKTTPWKMLLSHPATWACVVANFVNNFGFFILLAWMPKYFNDVVKLNLATSSWFSALPWATMAVSGVFAGILADRMLSEWKVSTATTRKFIQSVGFLGPALCLLVLGLKGFAITPGFALTTLTVAVGCTAFSQSGFLVNFAEIGPKYASTIHGVANTAGSIAGMVGTYVVGWILSRSVESGWSNVMYMTSATYVVGALVWLAFMSGEQVFF